MDLEQDPALPVFDQLPLEAIELDAVVRRRGRRLEPDQAQAMVGRGWPLLVLTFTTSSTVDPQQFLQLLDSEFDAVEGSWDSLEQDVHVYGRRPQQRGGPETRLLVMTLARRTHPQRR